VQVTLSSYEFYRALSHERLRHPELISASLTARLFAGGAVTRRNYEAAVADTRRCTTLIADVFAGRGVALARPFDLMLAPSAPGEATGIASTGEPTFGLMWTLLGLPCVTIPCGSGPSGLPLGVQLIAAANQDRGLLHHAAWAQALLSAQ
jgi:Asp-tRNA(Asn)/Glu-tRNA(Gln) amidotransferase A subunit family amidase